MAQGEGLTPTTTARRPPRRRLASATFLRKAYRVCGMLRLRGVGHVFMPIAGTGISILVMIRKGPDLYTPREEVGMGSNSRLSWERLWQMLWRVNRTRTPHALRGGRLGPPRRSRRGAGRTSENRMYRQSTSFYVAVVSFRVFS